MGGGGVSLKLQNGETLLLAVSFLVFGSIAMLAGSLKTYIERHPNSGAFLKWLQIVVFIGIAIFICI